MSFAGAWAQFWSDKPAASRRRITPDELAPIYGSGYSATEAGDKSPAGVWWEQTRKMSGGLDAGSKILWTSLSDQDQQIIENYYNDKVLKPAMDRWMEQAKNPPGDWGGPYAAEAEYNPFLGNIAKVDANGYGAHPWSTDAEIAKMEWKIVNPDSVASTLATFGLVPIDLIGTKGAKTYQGGASTQIGIMRLIDKSMPGRYGIDDAYIDDMEQRNKVMQAQRRATHKSHNAMEEGVVAGLIGGMAGLGAAGAIGGSGISAGVASGAAGGAVSSAITGNNVLRGAVTGGVMGGFGAAVGEYAKQFDGMAGSAIKAGGKVVSGLLAGKDPKQALISGAGSFVNNEAGGGLLGQMAGMATTGMLNNALSRGNVSHSSASQRTGSGSDVIPSQGQQDDSQGSERFSLGGFYYPVHQARNWFGGRDWTKG